jgi:hypothetical protein
VDEQTRRFYAKVEKYGGWNQVPAERIYEIFEEIIRPVEIGFVKLRRGFLSRKISEDIGHAIKLDALKGASYGISYGVALTYVPYPYVPKLRWHKTAKSAELALRDQPQTWEQKTRDTRGDGQTCVASSMLGETCFREEFGNAWRDSRARIEEWFRETVTLESVLLRCDEQLVRQKGGVRFVPEAELIRALTLGRLGRVEEAHKELERFWKQTTAGPEVRANLTAALQQIRPLKT